jgi:hypothetical protein
LRSIDAMMLDLNIERCNKFVVGAVMRMKGRIQAASIDELGEPKMRDRI